MSRNSEVLTALASIGVPVNYQFYNGSALTYATFLFIDETEALTADDEEQLTNYYLQVDLWAKPNSSGNYTNTLPIEAAVKAALNGIYYARTGAYDLPEMDTKIMHRAIRFKKTDVPNL
ncbi:hypothetical protein ACFP7A_00805 [Sporolactobacillus kofuensis]|uniref:Phage gp6-like head-tail connector protein n=1 Tax=Sporolactobacillus kofuensis TaxID=269672 RepID=A0ABW1W993_9BACL|nr:hypothetical protein [Sporolactobacillus kofuensis]MCO7175558.1 hypothetical protein [Sporolactobacillus kofuensis]